MTRIVSPGSIVRLACAGALPLVFGGCALFGSGPQQVEVHAFLDGHEVAGVGCMVANDVDRWHVVAPGRVTVVRSRTPLSVDCLRQGTGSDTEQAESPAQLARLEAHVRISAEDGYYASGGVGLAYAYPATLNIVLRAQRGAAPASAGGSPVF